AAAHLVRVSLARNPVGEVRYAARVARCRATREARHGEVEAAPEEVDGAALADEAGAERLHDPVGLDEHAPEALGVFGVVGRVSSVLRERDGGVDLVGARVDVDLEVELPKGLHHGIVEGGDRARLESDRAARALARLDEELVRDEVEVDLED